MSNVWHGVVATVANHYQLSGSVDRDPLRQTGREGRVWLGKGRGFGWEGGLWRGLGGLEGDPKRSSIMQQ